MIILMKRVVISEQKKPTMPYIELNSICIAIQWQGGKYKRWARQVYTRTKNWSLLHYF